MLAEAARLAAIGRSAALATVVRIAGSAYRQPGAKLLVADDGTMLGGVSGGCLEADVRDVALGVIRGDPPCLRRYDTGSDEDQVWGLGLGCNGMVEVLVDRVSLDDPGTRRAAELLTGDRPFALARVVAGAVGLASTVAIEHDGRTTGSTGDAVLDRAIRAAASAQLTARASDTVEMEGRRVFIEVLLPPPRLVICGAGDDAVPLASMAAGAGFRVTVVDHRPTYLEPARFPASVQLWQGRPEAGLGTLALDADTFVVIQRHSLTHDRHWALSAAESPAACIGLLGSHDRGERLVDALPPSARDRVYAPVGLDLGADGPEQIAVSVVAE